MGLNVARGLGQAERSVLPVGARDSAELATGLRRLRLGGVQHGGGPLAVFQQEPPGGDSGKPWQLRAAAQRVPCGIFL